MLVEVRKIISNKESSFKDFLNLPRLIYKDDPNWVMPLNREIRQKLNPKKNSFYDYSTVTNYVAYNSNNNPCGRISVINNPLYNKIQNEATVFFGLFECVDDIKIAQKLINHVFKGLKEKGYNKIIGPVNFTTNDESGFLIEGYNKPSTFMCNYCKSYYHNLMIACGFNKAIDTYSYFCWHDHPFPEKYYRIIKKFNNNSNLSLKKISKKSIKGDVLKIISIYNDSFSSNWGFVPITDNEGLEFANNLLPFVDEDLIWIAYYKDNPIGTILGFPDINELISGLKGRLFPNGYYRFMFSRNKIKGMRVAVLGVKKKYRRLGIETALIHKVHERVKSRPYIKAEFSVILENNYRMRNLLIRFGFQQTHKFRIYQRIL